MEEGGSSRSVCARSRDWGDGSGAVDRLPAGGTHRKRVQRWDILPAVCASHRYPEKRSDALKEDVATRAGSNNHGDCWMGRNRKSGTYGIAVYFRWDSKRVPKCEEFDLNGFPGISGCGFPGTERHAPPGPLRGSSPAGISDRMPLQNSGTRLHDYVADSLHNPKRRLFQHHDIFLY